MLFIAALCAVFERHAASTPPSNYCATGYTERPTTTLPSPDYLQTSADTCHQPQRVLVLSLRSPQG